MIMNEAYEKSLQIIKESNEKLTKKEYTKLAKQCNLLNVVSLEYISRKSFEQLVKELIREGA